jgi:hypothetical protein
LTDPIAGDALEKVDRRVKAAPADRRTGKLVDEGPQLWKYAFSPSLAMEQGEVSTTGHDKPSCGRWDGWA